LTGRGTEADTQRVEGATVSWVPIHGAMTPTAPWHLRLKPTSLIAKGGQTAETGTLTRNGDSFHQFIETAHSRKPTDEMMNS